MTPSESGIPTPSAVIDVLIVGAGPTGLALAADLARRGVSLRIIDVARGATDLSKAIGIQARTLEMLDNMGLADGFVARGQQGHSMTIHHDNAVLGRFSFKELDSPYPFLLMLPQSETERLLLAGAESFGAHIEREIKLSSFTQDDTGVTATLLHPDGQEEVVRASWIVGCDGSHSTVRHTLGLPFEGEAYAEGFQLADVKLEWEFPPDEIHLFLHETWIVAAFALPHGRYRLIFDVPPEQAPLGITPTLAELQTCLNERCPVPATISDPLWMANYRIHRRIVSQLREGRAFLVGDAAHIHSPSMAQGMNTGIQDALNLGWKLALVIQGKASPAFLDSYHAERYPIEQAVLRNTDLPLRALAIRNPIATAVRDKLMHLMIGLDWVQEQARRLVSEIGVEYPRSAIVEEHALGSGPVAGERAPDGPITPTDEVEEGDVTRLFDLLRGPHHKLLVFPGSTVAHDTATLLSLPPIAREYLGEGVKVHAFATDGAATLAESVAQAALSQWRDKGAALHQRYGAQEGGVYLVRPDGYIGFRSSLAEAAPRLESYLKRHFSPTP